MSLLPDIIDGRLTEMPEPYQIPKSRSKRHRKGVEGENLEALNNDGRKEVAEDFSDSPHLNGK